MVLDRGQTSVTTIDPDGSAAQHALRAGEGATTLAADSAGRVLVADTRGGSLLVFGTDPLMMRQSYPVRDAPYGLVGTRTLAWVSLTATNVVVGYDLATGIPVEKVRYPTVRQPDVLAFDDATSTLYVASVQRRRHPGDQRRGAAAVTLAGWDVDMSDDYEWVPLRLPPDVTRLSASTRLSIEAEYRGWELTRVRLYTDGSRRVLLRRRKTRPPAPDQPDRTSTAGAVIAVRLLRRLMFLVPAERIHTWVFAVLRLATAFAPARRACIGCLPPRDPVLASTVFGVRFPGPLGLAAGLRQGRHGPATPGGRWASASPRSAPSPPTRSPGNPSPRLFRLPADRALLNRMGFNNHGAGELALRLARHVPDVPIGVNIGKTKLSADDAVDDYRASARLVGPLADFVVVNVSSPNTPGLRDLQAVESLRPILAAVQSETTTPVLVKIAPDLSDAEVDDIADLAVELGLAGIVATNTTVSRDGLTTPGVDELGAGRDVRSAAGRRGRSRCCAGCTRGSATGWC